MADTNEEGLGTKIANGAKSAAYGVGNVAGDAAHAVQHNDWVDSGVNRIEHSADIAAEGVERLNPLGAKGPVVSIFRGIGNFTAGLFTLDGGRMGQGLGQIASPAVGGVQVAMGAVGTAIGGTEAALGKTGQLTMDAAYGIGDAAGNLTKDQPTKAAPQQPAQQEYPIMEKVMPPAEQSVVTSPTTVTITQDQGMNNPLATSASKAEPTHAEPVHLSEADRKLVEKALRDMSDAMENGFSVSLANKALHKVGAQELSRETSGADDFLDARDALQNALADIPQQYRMEEPSAPLATGAQSQGNDRGR